MNSNSLFLRYTFFIVFLLTCVSCPIHADESSFTRIDNISELNDGDSVIIVNEVFKKALSEWSGTNVFNSVSINIDGNVATASDYVTVFRIEKHADYYLLTTDGKYLSNASTKTKNACALKAEPDETSKANILYSEDHFAINFTKNVEKSLLYFSTNNCFSCYNSEYNVAPGRMLSLYKYSCGEVAPPNPPHLQSTSVKFSSTSVEIIKGEDYNLPVASIVLENGDVLTGEPLVYSSSDETVATVDETTGEITLNNFGTTIIKAQYLGSDIYDGSEGTYTLEYRDQSEQPTIVFSAANGAFKNLATSKPSSTTIWHNVEFIADDGNTYVFKHQDCYRGQKGFLANASSGNKHLRGPIFNAPNGYIVKITYDKKPQNPHPFIFDEEQMVYKENGVGDINGTKEYECIRSIPDSSSFVFYGAYIYYIKKIEIFINPVPSLDVSDQDTSTTEMFKKNDEKVVQFKLKRCFVNDGNWYTICLPFNISLQQFAKAFGVDSVETRTLDSVETRTLDSVTGNIIHFKEVEKIEAGVPYIIKPNVDIEDVVFDNVKISMTSNPTLQVGLDGYYMQGIYEPTELQTNGTNIFLSSENTFFKPSVNNNIMNGMRAYFIIPNSMTTQTFSFNADSETSGIVNTQYDLQQKDHKVYNINGIYIGNDAQNLTPGTYIVDGKKIIISN